MMNRAKYFRLLNEATYSRREAQWAIAQKRNTYRQMMLADARRWLASRLANFGCPPPPVV